MAGYMLVCRPPNTLLNLNSSFADKARSCRASEKYVGLVPEGPLLVAVYAVAVLVLLSTLATREM